MDEPVFIFSAGPRSGSTLLQRLIISSDEVMVWGESSGALSHILESFKQFNVALRPGKAGGANGAIHYQRFLESDDKSKQWVASINPPQSHILKTYGLMFENLYAVPAKLMHYRRCGIKEVRCTKSTMQILRLIFPHAKCILLVRNPLESLRSIKQHKFLFSDNWGNPVNKNQLQHFAKNWAYLSSMFLQEQHCFRLRYEDLMQNNFDVSKLCEYLEVNKLNTELLGGESVDWKAIDAKATLTKDEIESVMPFLEEGMRQWNYI